MTTETKARTGEDVSPAAEMGEALCGFLDEFKGFRAEITTRFQQQEDKMTMIERKSLTQARPQLAGQPDMHAPHRKAFDAYLRSGDDDGLRGLDLEGKALNTSVTAEGGYLVDPQTSETIRSVLNSTASIRAIANVVAVEARSTSPRRCPVR